MRNCKDLEVIFEIHGAIKLLRKFKVIKMFVLGGIIFFTSVAVITLFDWTGDGLFY